MAEIGRIERIIKTPEPVTAPVIEPVKQPERVPVLR